MRQRCPGTPLRTDLTSSHPIARMLPVPPVQGLMSYCRMEYKCLARCAGVVPIFDKGEGDVTGYCLACEHYVKLSYQHQVMQGRVRQLQKELEAHIRESIRKSIKVGRCTDAAASCRDRQVFRTQGCRLLASFVCCLPAAGIARLQAFRTQGCSLLGCKVASFSDARLQVESFRRLCTARP